MEIAQKRNANRTRYVFGEREVEYHLQDSSGSRSFSVAYTDLSRDRQTLVERNPWLRNAGLFWIVLGAVLTVVQWFQDARIAPSVWLFVGAIAYAAYRLRSTPFVIVPSDKGNLLVIDDDAGQRILGELASRRAAAYRAEYDFFPEGESPEQHRRRFNWLHQQGALTDEELRERMGEVEGMEDGRQVGAAPSAGVLLN